LKIASSYGGNQKEYWDVPAYELADIIIISGEPAASILKSHCNMKFEFLTAVFENVASCQLANCNRRFEWAYDLCQGSALQEE